MDDHMYEWVLSYGLCELVPRFQEEYEKNGFCMDGCPSYDEIKDFCRVLNIVAKWDGTRKGCKVAPSDFVPDRSELRH